jgi:hypothetical protein
MLTKTVAKNVSGLLQKHSIRASNLIDYNSDLNKTFMSRMLSGEHDFRISKLQSLCEALQNLEPSLTVIDLLDENLLTKMSGKSLLSAKDLSARMHEVIIDLIYLEWIEVKKDIPVRVIADYVFSAHIKRIIPESLFVKSCDKNNGV